MTFQPIFTGTVADDKTGDAPRTQWTKANANFLELYAALSQVVSSTKTANYTAVLADAGTLIEMNSASANTFTIPPNSAVAFPIGTVIEVMQIGAGQTTISPGAGVTLRPTTTVPLRAQWSSVSMRKRATDEWVISGDIA